MNDDTRRAPFSVTGWGLPGLVGVIVGVAALLNGAISAGVIGLAVGGAMLWYANRLRRRGVRW